MIESLRNFSQYKIIKEEPETSHKENKETVPLGLSSPKMENVGLSISTISTTKE